MWKDVFEKCVERYKELFERMENLGYLDTDNKIHVFALQYIYLPRINQSLKVGVRGTGGWVGFL